jgi:chemotaxis response regulator CheB
MGAGPWVGDGTLAARGDPFHANAKRSSERTAETMRGHDIIVIGASAGGIEPLLEIVRHLPADLPASILVAVHVWPRAESALPRMLS